MERRQWPRETDRFAYVVVNSRVAESNQGEDFALLSSPVAVDSLFVRNNDLRVIINN